MGARKKEIYAKLHVWHLPGRSISQYAPYSAFEADVVGENVFERAFDIIYGVSVACVSVYYGYFFHGGVRLSSFLLIVIQNGEKDNKPIKTDKNVI